MPRRSKYRSPWGYCGRCGIKTHLSDMKWQAGILKCSRKTCQDKYILGQRDREIQRVLINLASDNEEGKPDKTLTEPGLRIPIEEITI